MIVDVGKYLFFGIKEDLDLFFRKAQKLGLIEFVNPSMQKLPLPHYLENMHHAIQILKKLPEVSADIPEEIHSVDIVDDILNIHFSLESLYEEKRMIKIEIAKLQPFGDFSLEEIELIEKESDKRMFFYGKKHTKKEDGDLPEDLIFIQSMYDHDYFISLTKSPIVHPGLFPIHFEKSLSELKNELLVLEKKLKRKREELKKFAKYLGYLRDCFTKELDHFHLMEAKKTAQLELDQTIFISQAWIPNKYVPKVRQMIKNLHITFDSISIEKQDRIPTYMENKNVGALGEDLVHIYDTPSIDDKDPSVWVFFSFALFFAMIIADAGYGFIYLCASLFLSWKFKAARGLLKRFILLTRVLAITCIFWGVLTTSFFGIELKPTNPLSQFSLLGFLCKEKAAYHIEKKDDVYQFWIKEYPHLKTVTNPTEFLAEGFSMKEGKVEYEIQTEFNDNILMEISILVGIIHVALSLMRNLRRSLAGIGWILFIIGGYLYFPKILGATSMINFLHIIPKPMAHTIGLQILGTGVALAITTSLIQNRLGGLSEAFKMVEIFADVLSYLRLYALGLASMILAATFNDIGRSAGLFFGILIILIGHVTNITLGTMAGVIHGLRLNFLEWYHHSFEGGGRKFNPLKLS